MVSTEAGKQVVCQWGTHKAGNTQDSAEQSAGQELEIAPGAGAIVHPGRAHGRADGSGGYQLRKLDRTPTKSASIRAWAIRLPWSLKAFTAPI